MEKTIHQSSHQPQLMKNTYHLTFREEVGNAVSHGVMMFLTFLRSPFFPSTLIYKTVGSV